MSTELEKIKDVVMEKIHDDKIKMRPKYYFVIGSVLTFFGLIFSIVTSVFFISLIRFTLRSHGMMREYRLGQMILNFPWWIVLLALIFLGLGIWLLRRYDFSHKINGWHIIVGFILSLVIAGWVIDMTGINDTLSRRGPMKGMIHIYLQENRIQNNYESR